MNNFGLLANAFRLYAAISVGRVHYFPPQPVLTVSLPLSCVNFKPIPDHSKIKKKNHS